MAFRKAILGVSATGAVAGGVVLGKVGILWEIGILGMDAL